MQDRETQIQKHVQIAREFLDAADRFFEEDDLIQASEKLWGATAHAVKAACIRRRWRHGKYSRLREAAQMIADEAEDSSIMGTFLLAYSHHLNFYTNAMDAEEVSPARPIVCDLVDKLLGTAGSVPNQVV